MNEDLITAIVVTSVILGVILIIVGITLTGSTSALQDRIADVLVIGGGLMIVIPLLAVIGYGVTSLWIGGLT
jgi:hypothetical protein